MKTRSYFAIVLCISSAQNVMQASHIVRFHEETGTRVEIVRQIEASPLELVMIARAGTGLLTEEELHTCLAAGANIDAQDENGNTALIKTVSVSPAGERQEEIVQFLLRNEARIDIRNKSNFTAFSLSVENGHTNIVQLFINAKINVNVPLNINLSFPQTALFKSATKGYLNLTSLLLKAGAHVDAQNIYGFTALTLNMFSNHWQGRKNIIIKLLLAGANPLIKLYEPQIIAENLHAYNLAIDKHQVNIKKIDIQKEIELLSHCFGKTCFEVHPELLQDPDIQQELIERERLQQQKQSVPLHAAQQTSTTNTNHDSTNYAAEGYQSINVTEIEGRKKKSRHCVIL